MQITKRFLTSFPAGRVEEGHTDFYVVLKHKVKFET